MKIWQKKSSEQNSELVENFLAGKDSVLDHELIEIDILASAAHLSGLHDVGIVDDAELATIQKGLGAIYQKAQKGEIHITPQDEDVHNVVEQMLFAEVGDVAGKLHTLRSRNDQVLTDLRLFGKQELLMIWESTLSLAEVFLDIAKRHPNAPMPGYTHMQKAMPSSIAMWADAFAESLLYDAKLLEAAFHANDRSPLGSAAGYGTPMPVNREFTAKLLGFASVQDNPIFCQNSRGKVESTILFACISVAQTINRIASDVMLFTMQEFAYVSLPGEFTTGSSIMPQKKNYDVFELLRAQLASVVTNFNHILMLQTNLISGYNRDYQEMKEPFFVGCQKTRAALEILTHAMKQISFDKKKLRESLTEEFFVTHEAYKAVEKGTSFREAYREIGEKFFAGELAINVEEYLETTLEFPLDEHAKSIAVAQKTVGEHRNNFEQALKSLEKNIAN